MFAGHAPDVEAEIAFLRTEDGGRTGPVQSGYRPQFFYDGENHDAVHEYVDRKLVQPGETATVQLHFLHPELLYTRLREGEHFEIREGHRTVARGSIVRLLDLVRNAGELTR